MRNDASQTAFADSTEVLLREFGAERLEEKAFPTYANRLAPARYLAWSRVRHAQRMLDGASGACALDFGSGLGIMLPFLAERHERVIACDEDPEVTEFMVRRLGLANVEVVEKVEDANTRFDTVAALDVLEHIEDLGSVLDPMLAATTERGRWVITGPTENWLYGMMRKIARTKGEGHVHTIYGVLDAVPAEMRRIEQHRLPFGLPLFVVASYERRPATDGDR